MRAELPWNVAGIPPEAREAVRAAARREGLSIGEWLTRRIVRGFSGMEEEFAPMPYENRAPSGAPLDSWGLPPSAASRRDTEEMMARVGRSESESNEVWRRIDDQLRGLSRRLDSSERSHGESNRIISRTAQEMNIAAREQTQAFDQLDLTVMALNERLERLERSANHDGIKDAVKALHQGLSRLADQITATANNSASQVVTLTSNLEQLAGHVDQARLDSEEADKALDARIDASERMMDARLEAIDRALDTRLSSVEKTAEFNTSALDHALEKIEATTSLRATDQVENQKRAAQHEEMLHRLEDSVAHLEMRLPDAEFERRLDSIERSVSGMADRLEKYDPAEQFGASMQAMSCRMDALEKDHNDILTDQRNQVQRPVEPPPDEAPMAQAALQPAPQAFEPPPYAEPPPVHETIPEPAPFANCAGEATDAFLPPPAPHGFTFDIAPEPSDPLAPPLEFADVFADTPEPENFLAQAHRSARAASEKAESEGRDRYAAFRWGKDAAEGDEKTRSRYLLAALVAMLVVVAAAVALLLSQHAKQPGIAAAPVTRSATANSPTDSVPSLPDSNDTQFVVPPQSGEPQGDEKNYNTQHSEPDSQDAPARSAVPLKQRAARNAPVNPVPDAAKAGAAAPSADRLIQLANTGNPIALTILGLRALDGTNGAAVNLPDAAKFLTEAAEKGQAVAQYRLGTLYERGQGVPADPAKASHWYEMAANQGNRKAMHNLAVSYARGAAGKKNMPEAARWFARAAALGLSDSQFNLAVLYERGDGLPQSLLDAYKWYSIGAASGDSESKQRLGVLQTQLSDADKAAANKSAAIFHAAPLNRSANVPPEPADLGT